jgi:hypothetical protein
MSSALGLHSTGNTQRGSRRRGLAGTVVGVLIGARMVLLPAVPAGAVTIGNPANATARTGDEDESAIAVNPNNTQQIR